MQSLHFVESILPKVIGSARSSKGSQQAVFRGPEQNTVDKLGAVWATECAPHPVSIQAALLGNFKCLNYAAALEISVDRCVGKRWQRLRAALVLDELRNLPSLLLRRRNWIS